MGDAFTVRRLDYDDAVALGRLLEEVAPDFPIPLTDKVDPQEYAARLLSRGTVVGADGASERLVAVVGGYANDPKTSTAVITIVAAAREARGTGATDALICGFERLARREGMRRVVLDVHESNVPAIALYRRQGFEFCGVADHPCDVRMSKLCLGLTEERPNMLLTSVGRRGYLVGWFREALAGKGEVHVVNSAVSPAFGVADRATVCPQIYDDGYVPFLVRYCEDNRIGALLPLFDVDVPVLSAHAAELREAGCLPVVASPEVAAACNDKLRSEAWLHAAGLRSTRSWPTLGEAERALASGGLSFPVIVKPRWGMGSIGVEVATDLGELRALYGIVRRRVRESYLRFESAADMESAVLVQEPLPGQEWGMDVMNGLDGRLRGVVTRKKLAMRSGETDVAEVVPAPASLVEAAERISAASRHPGNMDVDLFVDGNDVAVLEMNARFGGGYPFGHAAGVDLPRAIVEWLRGNDAFSEGLKPTRFGKYCKDIRVIAMSGNSDEG